MKCGTQGIILGLFGKMRDEEIKVKNAFWKHRNVFVTGCTGLLGSWMVKYLMAAKANVVGLVRDHVPQSPLYQNGFPDMTIVRGELEDLALLERAMNEYEIDTVFHLGAQTIVGVANRNPISTFEANIKGTWNVLEAARRTSTVTRVVVASSDKAYGDQDVLPYSEEAPLVGRHPYDVSKSCSDLITQSYYHTYHLPVAITRCGNFYGGGDLNFNRLVPGTIRSVLNGESPIIRSDGSYIRDYFYVEDGVLAYLHLAEQMDREEIWGEAFNFSNELQIPVIDLVDHIIKKMNSNLEPIIQNRAVNEIIHQYLSAQKAREMLHWAPQFTLDVALEQTISWYREFLRGGD